MFPRCSRLLGNTAPAGPSGPPSEVSTAWDNQVGNPARTVIDVSSVGARVIRLRPYPRSLASGRDCPAVSDLRLSSRPKFSFRATGPIASGSSDSPRAMETDAIRTELVPLSVDETEASQPLVHVASSKEEVAYCGHRAL